MRVHSSNTHPPVARCIGRALPETHFSAKKAPETTPSAVHPLPEDKNARTSPADALKAEENTALRQRYADMTRYVCEAGAGSLICSAEGQKFIAEFLEVSCLLFLGMRKFLTTVSEAERNSPTFRLLCALRDKETFRSEK